MTMGSSQLGLRKRLAHEARRVSSQHRQLDSLCQLVSTALVAGPKGDASALLEQVRDALHAHFELEEQVYYPALHGLRPESRGSLEELLEDHGRLRSELSGFERSMMGTGSVASVSEWSQFSQALVNHEKREEDLLSDALGTRLAPPATRGRGHGRRTE